MIVEDRIRAVLAAMARVSEADGQSVVLFDPNTSHKSTIPSGVRTGQQLSSMDPSAPRTLFDEWAARFDRHRDADEFTLRLLVTAAETALNAYRHRHPGREVDEHDDPTAATEARCLREYHGMTPQEAGVIEAEIHGGDPNRLAAWMRNVRVRNGRHPDTGEHRPAGEHRLKRVAELRAQGLGAKRIARELGCAPSTVQEDFKRLERAA